MSKFAGLGLATEVPSRLILLHPGMQRPLRDRDGKEAYIDLLSLDSEPARKHQRAITDARLALKSRQKVKAAQIEEESVELFAALTTGWHLVKLNGEPIPVECTLANARELYSLTETAWIKDQVAEYVYDRSNFIKA